MSGEKDEKLVKFVVLEESKEGEGKGKKERVFDLSMLFQRLEDEDPEIREKVTYILADCAWIAKKFDEILWEIVKCLEDVSEKVRGGAAYAIAKYAEARVANSFALLKLVERLEDRSEYVVQRAADAITKYYDNNFFYTSKAFLETILGEKLISIIEKSKSYLPERVSNFLLPSKSENRGCRI